MEESKLLYLQDRADWLARNFWLKTYRRGNWEILNGMKKLNRMECKDRLTNPTCYVNVFSSSFREVSKNREEIEIGRGFEIWEKDYWSLTKEITGDVEIGRDRQKREMKDETLIQQFKEKYSLGQDTQVMYTDASKMKTDKSVGIDVIMREEDVAYEMSINSKCSVFTGEIVGIEHAIYMYYCGQGHRQRHFDIDGLT